MSASIKKNRTSLQDVKVHRGTYVASDHHFVINKLRLKLKRYSVMHSAILNTM
jgi:hypothetical protein